MKHFKTLREVLGHYAVVRSKDELRTYFDVNGRHNFEKTYTSLTAFFSENPPPVKLVTADGRWLASYGLVGVRLRGTVVKMTNDGALIRFEDGITAVLERQDFARGRESEPLQDPCRVGSELTVVVWHENYRGGLLVGPSDP